MPSLRLVFALAVASFATSCELVIDNDAPLDAGRPIPPDATDTTVDAGPFPDAAVLRACATDGRYQDLGVAGSRYRIAQPTDWFAAAALCESDDAELSSLDSALETGQVADLVAELASSACDGEPCGWLGLLQGDGATEVDDNWFWLDGAPVFPWLAGQPDDGDNVENGAEQCGATGPRGLEDRSCMMPAAAVCECQVP